MTAQIVATVLAGIAICVGLVGIVVPVLPGSILIGIAVLVWAIVIGTGAGWATFAIVAVCVALGMSASWVLTGRKLKRMEIPTLTLVVSGIVALVGFFLIPVVGLLLGFVVGLFAMEYYRLKDRAEALKSAWIIIKTAAVGIVVELAFAAIAATTFAVGCFVYFKAEVGV